MTGLMTEMRLATTHAESPARRDSGSASTGTSGSSRDVVMGSSHQEQQHPSDGLSWEAISGAKGRGPGSGFRVGGIYLRY